MNNYDICNNEVPFCFSITVPPKLDASKIEFLDFTFDVSSLQCIIEPIPIDVDIHNPCHTKKLIPSKSLINQIRVVGCIQIFSGLYPLISKTTTPTGRIPNPAKTPPFLSSGLGSLSTSEIINVDRILCYTSIDDLDPCPDLSKSTFTAFTGSHTTNQCGYTLIPIKGSIFLPTDNH
ncbi:hypothetical protein BTW32_31345 [Bacillus thuringiensis]|nr:hypothetical protein BTW32_31345 [Bacillus thuringiensis]